MSETFRQACEEFRGGYFTNMENGSIYPVSQVIAFPGLRRHRRTDLCWCTGQKESRPGHFRSGQIASGEDYRRPAQRWETNALRFKRIT